MQKCPCFYWTDYYKYIVMYLLTYYVESDGKKVRHKFFSNFPPKEAIQTTYSEVNKNKACYTFQCTIQNHCCLYRDRYNPQANRSQFPHQHLGMKKGAAAVWKYLSHFFCTRHYMQFLLYPVKKTAMFPRFQLPEIKFSEAKSWKEKSPWNQMTLVVQSSALLYWPFY